MHGSNLLPFWSLTQYRRGNRENDAHSSLQIILSGDSAGGNLLLALLSHLIHPHPEVPPIFLPPDSSFRGAALLSPWVTFDTESSDSMRRNRAKDVLHIPSLETWSAQFTGSAPPDNYLDPLRAPAEWWVGLPIRHILLVSGADEIFVDDIDVFARKLSVWLILFLIAVTLSHEGFWRHWLVLKDRSPNRIALFSLRGSPHSIVHWIYDSRVTVETTRCIPEVD